jgi:phenylpropionate dioxygenase-like ring-hydroxylating dioxygenase large terminal subunit
MSRFPFPMPFGWFKVAMPEEIPDGMVVNLRMFGTDLILWRDGDGNVVCQEAFCAHLGAHLGVGGTVESSCIRCPFHGWAWGPGGENVDIPYATRPNRKAKLRTYPTREHVGIVFAWYHPSEASPLWELMSIPEYEDPEFGEYQVFDKSWGKTASITPTSSLCTAIRRWGRSRRSNFEDLTERY